MTQADRIQRHRSETRGALTSAQWAIYDAGWGNQARFRVAVCGRRFGKALAVDTLLPSPDGWIRMGDVQNGVRLFDEKGQPCRVVFTSEVMLGRPCNEVWFDDATRIIADDDHLWEVTAEDGAAELMTTRQMRLSLQRGYALFVLACGALTYGRVGGRAGELRRWRLLRRLWRRFGGQRGEDGRCAVRETARVADLLEWLCLSLGLVPKRNVHEVRWSVLRRARRRRVVRVQPVRSRAVRCLQVDSPSRLFLCGRALVPTHNTFLMAEELRRAARLAVRHAVGVENEIWYGAPNFLQAKRVMWGRLKKAIPTRWLDGRPNETSCVLRLKSGHIIRLVGLDAAENLRGSGLWFFGGDEWADCRPEAWKEVVRPMLSASRGHALFIGTPKGFDHFRDAYVLGQEGGDPAYRSFLFTTADGGNVPEDELLAARRELDPRTYRQEYCASFESYAGRVIYAFSRTDNVCAATYAPNRPLHVGMDFNINPMSATIWQDEGRLTRQIDEIVLPTSNTDEMAEEIARRYGRVGFDPARPDVAHITIYPDPAGAQRRTSAGGRTDVGILKERGFKVIVPRSHPPVRDRVNGMNRAFRDAGGNVSATVDPRCVKSIEAYERLTYREGTNEPDKRQGYDHLVDASGYFLFGRNGPESTQERPGFFMAR